MISAPLLLETRLSETLLWIMEAADCSFLVEESDGCAVASGLEDSWEFRAVPPTIDFDFV